MRLTVVLPFHDAADTIGEQLDALERNRWHEPWEIVAVDNRSTDEGPQIVAAYQERMPHLRLVEAEGAQAASHARNVGAEVARGEYLAFCDADDAVADDWVAHIGAAVQEHAFVASRNDAKRLSDPVALKAKGNKRQQEGLIEYTYVPFLPFASTSGLAIRRDLHEAVGGFDESMRYLEDCDYCWRVQLDGTPLVFAPSALIHIRHRSDALSMYRQARNWGEYNVVLLKRYRHHGMAIPSWKVGLGLWWKLVRRTPGLLRRSSRYRFLWALGYRVGQVRGSIKHRVLAL